MACSKLSKLHKEDCCKLKFTMNAIQQPDPFGSKITVPEEVRAAMKWHMGKSPEKVISETKKIINEILTHARAMKYVLHPIERCHRRTLGH